MKCPVACGRDGLLSKTEVSARLWTKLTDAKADTNTDGGISFDELLAFQGAASTGSGCDHGGSSETDSFSTTLVANVLRKSGNGWGQPFYTF